LSDAVFELERFQEMKVLHRYVVALEILRNLRAQRIVRTPQVVANAKRDRHFRRVPVDSGFHER
jgi:hypothetical protein